jgi:hypothetical protein
MTLDDRRTDAGLVRVGQPTPAGTDARLDSDIDETAGDRT